MSQCRTIRILFLLGAALCAGTQAGHAQDIPASNAPSGAPGFQLPRVGGSLTYALNASESIAFGYYGNSGTYQSTNLSGDLAYLSPSKSSPFSLVYSGGYLFSTSYQPSSFFQNLAASQVLVLDRWSVVLSDSFSYLPNAPIEGLSGIPGVGDLGVAPIQVLQGDQGYLFSNYGIRITNTAAASVSRSVTNRTSIFGSGAYTIFRFPGSASAGLETNAVTASGGASHNLSARTSVAGSYSFSRSDYPQYAFSYNTQSFLATANHQWTAKLSGSVSAGPQYSSTQNSSSTLSVAASANLAYLLGKGSLGASFSRGVNSGEGVTTTGISDSASVSYSHMLGEYTGFSTNASYTRFSTLPISLGPEYSTDSFGGGVQLSRSFTRNLSAFASYNVQHQTNDDSSLAVNAFHGTAQTVGFGITYSPARPIVLGH